MRWERLPAASGPMMTLTEREVKLIQTILAKARSGIESKHDHFADLHEAGAATDRQVDKMIEYEAQLEVIDEFINM